MTDEERNKDFAETIKPFSKLFNGFLSETALSISVQEEIIKRYNITAHIAYTTGYRHGLTQLVEELTKLSKHK